MSIVPAGARRRLAGALLLAAAPLAPLRAQEIVLRAPPESARVYARDGSLLAELGPQARTVVPLRSLPPHVWKAFVAVEDRRFFEHGGVDAVGIARAAVRNLEGEREGASTITQQLIGAMYPERVDRTEITVERKLREARLALELEERYGKERILEAYLNWIYFGHGWYGVEAAARHYFGKPAAKLALEEGALLAGLVKGPGIYSPKIDPEKALARRNLVLDAMAAVGAVSASEAAAAKRRPIRLAPNHGYAARPPWVIEQVRRHLASTYGEQYGRVGLRVWTTVDPSAQNAADSALARGLAAAEAEPWYRGPRYGTAAATAGASGTNYLQGAVVSLDARTGEILALVGGRDWKDSQYDRVTQARRQPGSAFKPIVYALAVERGLLPSSLVQDTALRIERAGSPPYEPRNDDGIFRGPVTLRQALTLSINSVAIQLGMETGLDTVAAHARRFGIASPIPPYPSSMIGAGAVRPLELAGAYTTFANGGMRVEPFLVRRVADRAGKILFEARAKGTRTLSPETAFLVTDMLADAAERGTGREARERLQPAVPMAGKTGTTNDGSDVWYVGFTPEVVTAVWVGFDAPRSIGEGAYGGTLAAPIWGEMMREVHAARPAPAPWPVPAGLAVVATDPLTGLPATGECPASPTRPEYFPAGAEPADACVLRPAAPLLPDALPADSVRLDSIPLPADTALTRRALTRRP